MLLKGIMGTQALLFFLGFFFFVILGLELSAFTFSHCTSPNSVKDFSELGSQKLFARAGFEPRSS
jgi:hypothetical protein